MKYEMSIDGNFALNVLTTEQEYNASYERFVAYPSTWGEGYPKASWGERYGHNSIEFLNKMWVFGGNGKGNVYYNDAWYSIDGKAWTRATEHVAWSARYGFILLKFNNKLWIIGGNDGTKDLDDVWSSTDGITWIRVKEHAALDPRSGHAGLVFDNKMWILGGSDDSGTPYNDVWSTVDGINWIEYTTSAVWDKRSGHAGLVFDNKMWVFGGDADGIWMNDVWSSTDGIRWVEATFNASWSERYGHAGLVFDNKMWVFGGSDDSDNYYTDTWYSVNGIDWIEETVDVSFTDRRFFGSLVFDNKMWAFGGEKDRAFLNTVISYTSSYSQTVFTYNSLSLASMDTASYTGRFSQFQTAIGGAYVVNTRSSLQIQDREVVMQFNIIPDKPDEYISNKWFGKYLSLLKQVDSIKYNTPVDLFDMITIKKDIVLDLKYVYHSIDWIEHNMIGVLTVVYYDTGNGWYTDLNLSKKINITSSAIIRYDNVDYPYGAVIDYAFKKGFTSISPSFHFWLKDNTSFPDWFFIAHNNGDEIMYLDFSVLPSSYLGVPANYFYISSKYSRVSCQIKSNPTKVRYIDKIGGVFGIEQFRRLERTTNLYSKGYGFTLLCSHPNVIYEATLEGRFYLEM